MVGQVGGNIGNGITQARAMAKIRRNMEELKKVIRSLCPTRTQVALCGHEAIVGMMTTLKEEVFSTEEKRILEGVIEAAKAAAQAGA
jgi:hypothetical protein